MPENDSNHQASENNIELTSQIFHSEAPFAEEAFLSGKPNTAICFSGGGTRAMVLGMGQMRGIEQLELMKNVRYSSSVSGGSWANTAYAYRRRDETTSLIGEYKSPADLTIGTLKENEPDMAYVNGRSFLHYNDDYSLSKFSFNMFVAILRAYVGQIQPSQVWQYAVGLTYLGSSISLMSDINTDHFSLDRATKDAFDQANPDFKDQRNKVFLKNPNSPYPIVNGIITGLDGQKHFLQKDYIGIEFTPLYTAVANGRDNAKEPFSRSILLGNGALDTLAMGGAPISAKEGQVTVTQADIPLSLAAAAGISSNFLGAALISEAQWFIDIVKFIRDHLPFLNSEEAPANRLQEENASVLKGLISQAESQKKGDQSLADWLDWLTSGEGLASLNPQMQLFSPNAFHQSEPKYGNFTLGDGGSLDNYGIMPMLRRKVERIVVFINSDAPLSTELLSSYRDISPDFMDDNLTSLFGRLNDGPISSVGRDLSHNHVLNAEPRGDHTQGIKEVVQNLQEAKKKGDTVMTTTKHEVISNRWWGIHPYTVEVCWVYNEIVLNWENELPQATQKELELGRYRNPDGSAGAFDKNFPLVNTITSTAFGLSTLELNLLGHLAAWNVAGEPNKAAFEAILRE